mmetsp:Transcript_11725/g.29452  ORF Transcript_11725/g.29452 Transcript_11725/m.29452 type:complete len:250 (+) Transcript_11725:643-1392(+)
MTVRSTSHNSGVTAPTTLPPLGSMYTKDCLVYTLTGSRQRYPTGQSMQPASATVPTGEVVPGGQDVGTSPPTGQKKPGGQAAQPSLTGQVGPPLGSTGVAATPDRPVVFPHFPAGHKAQPTGPHEPMGHADPAGHGRQLTFVCMRRFGVNVPAGHAVGSKEPIRQKKPQGQPLQALTSLEPCAPLNLPAGQSMQEVWPLESWYLPVEQFWHALTAEAPSEPSEVPGGQATFRFKFALRSGNAPYGTPGQ